MPGKSTPRKSASPLTDRYSSLYLDQVERLAVFLLVRADPPPRHNNHPDAPGLQHAPLRPLQLHCQVPPALCGKRAVFRGHNGGPLLLAIAWVQLGKDRQWPLRALRHQDHHDGPGHSHEIPLREWLNLWRPNQVSVGYAPQLLQDICAKNLHRGCRGSRRRHGLHAIPDHGLRLPGLRHSHDMRHPNALLPQFLGGPAHQRPHGDLAVEAGGKRGNSGG